MGRGKGPCSGGEGGEASRDSCTLEPTLGWSQALGLAVQPTPSLPAPHSLTGISGKSQVLFAVVFTARYLDLFTNYISLYNTCMKVKALPFLWASPAEGGAKQGS